MLPNSPATVTRRSEIPSNNSDVVAIQPACNNCGVWVIPLYSSDDNLLKSYWLHG
ncbi:MAG: hypothetical protein R3E08_00675 [Thiotrichaceae bacterium]